MGVGSNPTSDITFFVLYCASWVKETVGTSRGSTDSRVAQWKRAGPITQRSVDRNYALLVTFTSVFFLGTVNCQKDMGVAALVPLAQRIARWTSNPKVLGSIPRWDEQSLVP